MNARSESKSAACIKAATVIRVFIVCCVIMIGGCEPSVQRGKFTANSTFGVVTNLGRYVEIIGTKAGSSERQPLLRILTVFTSEPLQDDVREAHGELETVIDFVGKNHDLSVTWDRQTDRISVAGLSFDRRETNLIACVFDGKSWNVFGGNIDPRQRNAKAIEDTIRNEFSTQIPELDALKLPNIEFPEL